MIAELIFDLLCMQDMPDLINMQTRMFCGFGPECAPGLDQMEQAKLAAERLENEFLIVGLLDKLPQLFRVLEVSDTRADPSCISARIQVHCIFTWFLLFVSICYTCHVEQMLGSQCMCGVKLL